MIKKERKIDMDDLKQQAIILFKEYPESISVSLLQRHLRIGVIKANKIMILFNVNYKINYEKR